ncbi:MAG: hypothetical protein LBQ20_04130 [Rhodanobacter sp.]|jgi:hypothetical protein|nr:hypothetical protein [Rhodanobacter sp.]
MRTIQNRQAWWSWCCQLGCLLALALTAEPSLADTSVSGLIGSNTTWQVAQSPYVLQGDVVLDNSVPSVASVASRVTVAEGQVGTDVEVQANAIGTTTVTASQSSLGTAVTLVEVVDLPMLEIAPGAPTIGVQRPYPMRLTLPQPAPAGGVSVTLSNSDPAVVSAPSSLFVSGGQQGVNFEVTGLAEGMSRISAQAEGFATGMATITVRGKALVLPGSVVVAPGAQTPVMLTLTDPAPAGGLTVSLGTDAAGTASVPDSVSVAEGAGQVGFNVTGVALGTTTLQASASGYQSAQTTVRVDAIALAIDPSGNLALNVERSLTRRVLLSKTAPPGGVTVQVAAADPSLAAVSPAEVFVPEGQIYGLTPVTVKGMAVGSTTLDLSAPGLIGTSVPLVVNAKIALLLYQAAGQSKVVVGKAMTSYLSELVVRRLVNGVVSTGGDPVTVSLRCVDASVCSVPATVTIAANGSQVIVPVSGLEIGSTQIKATADGMTAATPM